MKAKVNVNSDGMKQFFAAHGEKVAFGVLLALTAFIGYSASQVQIYGEGATGYGPNNPKNAATLAKEVAQARTNVETSHDPKRTDLPAVLVKDGVALPKEEFGAIIARLFLSKLDPAKFGGIEWNRPLRDMKTRRVEPTYLAAQGVRASFHVGALKFNAEPKIRGEEWVCVTALVPNQQQIDEYRSAFQNAADPKTNSIPKYGIYEIRRAVVDPNAPADAPINWEQDATLLNLAEHVNVPMATWDGTSRELAEIKYAQWPYLTQPLPPVADSTTLGEWCAHVPEVPMFQPGAAAAPQAAAPAVPQGGVFPNPNNPNNPAAPVVEAAEPAAGAEGPPPYYLLRFFDFNIEPGKAYRYQIRLVFKNPNEGLNLAFLEKPELAVGPTREAPWSNPSPPALFPILENYFAGDLDPANGDSEPTSNVAARIWAPKFGADIFFEYAKRLRGAVLNASGEAFFRVPGKPESANVKTEVVSNAMLVDFSWERRDQQQRTAEGRPISRPSEVLLLSPRGELMITTQLMHWPQWEEFKGLVAGGAPPGPVPPGPPGPNPVPPVPGPGPFQLK
jgi:hypothetical protein